MGAAPRLRSSDVDVALEGASVVFMNGSGFGHGVGLSQWGAHGLAAAGRDHADILEIYYPTAVILRLYP